MTNKNQVYFFANWKMYLGVEESINLAQVLVKEKKKIDKRLQLAIFPSSLALCETQKAVGGELPVGAQNGFWVDKGGYTGEVSMKMYASAGIQYVLVGHSERRHVFEETDEEVNKKILSAIEAGLIPVLCVGETAAERDEEQTEEVVLRQLHAGLSDIPEKDGLKIVIAYEPVWAIGTGRDCSPAEAGKVHKVIEDACKKILPKTDFTFLYGGSVNGENVVAHIADLHVDGVLVGNASSQEEKAKGIIEAIQSYLCNI